MKVIDDGDIGMCDLCLSETGDRKRVLRDGKFNDGPARYAIYACPPCRAEVRRRQAAA